MSKTVTADDKKIGCVDGRHRMSITSERPKYTVDGLTVEQLRAEEFAHLKGNINTVCFRF